MILTSSWKLHYFNAYSSDISSYMNLVLILEYSAMHILQIGDNLNCTNNSVHLSELIRLLDAGIYCSILLVPLCLP